MKHLRELRCRWVRVLKLAASGEKNRFRLFNLFLELSNFAALSIVLRRFCSGVNSSTQRDLSKKYLNFSDEIRTPNFVRIYVEKNFVGNDNSP